MSPACLDELEKLCSLQQKLRIEPAALKQLPCYLTHLMYRQSRSESVDKKDIVEEPSADLSRVHEVLKHEQFLGALGRWMDITGLQGEKAVEVALSVAICVGRDGHLRRGSFREHIMIVLAEIKRDVRLLGAYIPIDANFKPPEIPAFFPHSETTKDYIQRCISILERYTQEVVNSYTKDDLGLPTVTREEEQHIEWLAYWYINKPTLENMVVEFGRSKSTLSGAMKNLKKRMGLL